ncbi:hypothetical protein AB9Q10_16225 [Streptomyces krungchingensis]|uniref:hypothetical protein n=1 Tax=Streptomyces krungchingensis TaxID=1565034 RepID=UPI003CE8C361
MGTQTTDTITKAEQALTVMDSRAQHVRAVSLQLLGEHAAGLPELMAVRVEASSSRQQLALQPYTVQDARQWAAALDVTLTVSIEDAVPAGWRAVHARANLEIEGVQVHLGSYQTYSPEQWAEHTAAVVAA